MGAMSFWNNTDSKTPLPNSTDKWFHSSFIADNETEVESILEEMKANDIREKLTQVYPIVAVATILIAVVAAYLFILLTLWERFGMDPMKRGITNRVSHCYLFKEFKKYHNTFFSQIDL